MALKKIVCPGVCECGDHAFAAITRGHVTLVSVVDVDQLRHKWRAGGESIVYACREKRTPDGYRSVSLPREILDCPPWLVIDHINTNGLDNRRQNIRACTQAENLRNRHRPKKAKGPFKGVRQRNRRFQAVIQLDGKLHNLGFFSTAEEARGAYAEAAVRLHGEFARLD